MFCVAETRLGVGWKSTPCDAPPDLSVRNLSILSDSIWSCWWRCQCNQLNLSIDQGMGMPEPLVCTYVIKAAYFMYRYVCYYHFKVWHIKRKFLCPVTMVGHQSSEIWDHCNERSPVLKTTVESSLNQSPPDLKDHICMANGVVFQDRFYCNVSELWPSQN